MMGRLSTHVLDIVRGKPAEGVAVELFRLEPSGLAQRIAATKTNADGRTDPPLLSGESFALGVYELRFEIGAYFLGQGAAASRPPFLDVVPLRFTISEPDGRYHVPLLCSPWSYSTYRGS